MEHFWLFIAMTTAVRLILLGLHCMIFLPIIVITEQCYIVVIVILLCNIKYQTQSMFVVVLRFY